MFLYAKNPKKEKFFPMMHFPMIQVDYILAFESQIVHKIVKLYYIQIELLDCSVFYEGKTGNKITNTPTISFFY